MSQRQLSRNFNNNEQQIQEQNGNNDDLSRKVEEQSDDECSERYSRYDPKELRDAARILSPFLKLTDEVNNPYARLVAAESCDTFYSLFNPNMDPLDVKKSFKPLLTSQKSMQIWNEFRLYTPDSKCKEWVPLCKEPIVEINEECDPFRPQDEADCGPTDQQQRPNSEKFNRQPSQSNNRSRNHTQNCDINEPPAPTRRFPDRVGCDNSCFSDSDDTFYDISSPNNSNGNAIQNSDINELPAPIRQSPDRVSYNSCFSDLDDSLYDVNPPNNMLNDSYQNLCNISPPNNMFDDSYQSVSDDDRPANTCCGRQLSAGSDSLPVTQRSKPNVQNTMSYRASIGNRKNYTRLYSKYFQDKSDDVECNERLPVDTYLDVMSEESIDKNETDNSALQQVSSHRQRAGNDVYLPSCEPGSSTDPGYVVQNDAENPDQYEYYRLSGNSPSPLRNANGPNALQTVETSPIEPELRTNALDDIVNNYGGDDSDSDESLVNMNQIANNAKIVANAFTNVSLAQQEVERKKNAFGALTKNYFNNASNPVETDRPSAGTRSTKKMLKAICKNPPSTLRPFDNSEWNDNCFRDKDFVRLLPFFEIVHNQLEYIATTQKDYGFNMLDDIMSVFYHIHYELGDPRLKNDLLVEHVKLVTKNTWESFFYPENQKMPAIPEKPDRYFSQSPQQRSMSQRSSPTQVRSRQASPKSPNQVPPAPRQISQEPPRQETLPSSSTGQSGPCQEQRPRSCTDANRRPRAESRSNRAPDVPQQTENPPVTTKKNFLRKSQASGTPKAWVPKVKAVERPKELNTFKAKPLPKFVRDRINRQNENC